MTLRLRAARGAVQDWIRDSSRLDTRDARRETRLAGFKLARGALGAFIAGPTPIARPSSSQVPARRVPLGEFKSKVSMLLTASHQPSRTGRLIDIKSNQLASIRQQPPISRPEPARRFLRPPATPSCGRPSIMWGELRAPSGHLLRRAGAGAGR